MERLFSEIYNRYFVIVQSLLSHKGKFSKKLLQERVQRYGFGESLLFLLPKLVSNEWELFEICGDEYYSKLPGGLAVPLSRLQKRWLKAVLADPRAPLFFDDAQLMTLREALKDCDPLFHYEDFRYYDRFKDGDDYSDPEYRLRFRRILEALNKKQLLRIRYIAKTGRDTNLTLSPRHLEYSVKNDCFRLLGRTKGQKYILRLSRMKSVTLCTKTAEPAIPDSKIKQQSVTLLIRNERNAMERAMLQFADYRKNTLRLDDGSYRCEIFYDKDDETELLIEILSFGPMLQVIENEHFISLIRERLQKQCGYAL